MSTYLLATHDRDSAAETELLPLLTRQGYVVVGRREVAGRRLVLVDNPTHSVIVETTADNGDWIVTVGPFLYEGLSGRAALQRYLAQFSPDRPTWTGTQGHFTLLIHKGGQLHILCDGLGAHKIYHDPDDTVLSNSFLAVLAMLPERRLDVDGAYIYAWTGACQAGRTFVEQIRFRPANTVVSVGNGIDAHQHPSPILADLAGPSDDFDACAESNLARLQAVIDSAATYADGRIRLSFSGGFDSRLLLGALRRSGVRPELYVYGHDGATDVRIAHEVATPTGLTLRHVDKDAYPAPTAETMPDRLERALVCFDGWTNTGLFDSGADLADRPTRHAGGFVPMNGGLGEIYRNFFNLRGRSVRLDDIVSSFYYSFDPAWATERFDIRRYHETIVAQLGAQLDTDARTIDMQRAQLLYPLFRGRFWTAREAEINQRFGPMLFPYLEHACIAGAAQVPAAGRHLGRVQADMIRRVDPELAALDSAYGFAFARPPGLRHRADALRSLARPMWLRRRSYRFRAHPDEPDLSYWWHAITRVIDPDYPYTSLLFKHANITDSNCVNRVMTMEWLAQRFGFHET
jgi:asparagine synthase (glutamine-hydrolysing)